MQDPEKGLGGRLSTEDAIHMLVKSYDSSEISHQVQKELSQIKQRVSFVKHLISSIAKKNRRELLVKLYKLWMQVSYSMEKKSHADFLTQCLILTRRSFVNMYREAGYYWLRLLIYGALALSLGTMFFDIGSSNQSIQARGSLLVFVVTFLTFITVAGFPSFVEDMKVK